MEKFQTEALRRALEALGKLVIDGQMAIPSAEKFATVHPAVEPLRLNPTQFAAMLEIYQNACAATFLAYNVMKNREVENPKATPQEQLGQLSYAISTLENGQG